MSSLHAVGIDLGTTYSSIAYLNAQGEPVSIPSSEGEFSTPSAVLFEQDGSIVVGAEALRNAIISPLRVVQYAKRYIGDREKTWEIDGRRYTPVDISAFILSQLLADARGKIGSVERAIITVPAQFSDLQRRDTVQAGHQAGLKQIEIINEPVAAALCHVLGSEGLWFSELADEQRLLVYDLGGGTFDLSLVAYRQNEVRVLASTGDLQLGGIDWNAALLDAIAKQFTKEFGSDPRTDPSSYQQLALEAEQCKRSLTVRPKAALMVQHDGKRKTYQVELAQFQRLTQGLVDRTIEITKKLLKDNNMGWAKVDVVLSTGGSSRMPAIRDALKQASGRTLNSTLSPDLSIVHGATYYAGMLLSNQEFARSILNTEASQRLASIRQQSVTARSLGVMIRDTETNTRIPYYLIDANTPVPAAKEHLFGTATAGQRKVRLTIVESGATSADPVEVIGECLLDNLPEGLPIDSEIIVTLSYDAAARICLSGRVKATGQEVTTELVREESLRKVDALAGPSGPSSPAIPTRPGSAAQASVDSDEVLLEMAEDELLLEPVTDRPATGRPETGRSETGRPAVKLPPLPELPDRPKAGGASSSEIPLPVSPPPLPTKKPAVKALPLSPALRGKAEGQGASPRSTEGTGQRPPQATQPASAKRQAEGGDASLLNLTSGAGPKGGALPSLDDQEILELPLGAAKKATSPSVKSAAPPGTATPPNTGSSSGRKSAQKSIEKPGSKSGTKPSPKPSTGSGPTEEGEDEFWRLAENIK
jgi:molecular chaperone DnaK